MCGDARTRRAAPQAQAERSEMARPDAVSRLLARKAELKLTDDQVTRLTAIQARYKALNQPHIDAMRASRPDSATRDSMRKEMRERGRAQRERRQAEWAERYPERAAARQALAENARKQRTEVEAILTAEQKAMLRDRARAPRMEDR